MIEQAESAITPSGIGQDAGQGAGLGAASRKLDGAAIRQQSAAEAAAQLQAQAAAGDPEYIRKSRLAFSEAFGAAAWLLSHDKAYQDMPLRVLESAVSAPLRLGQFKLYRKEGIPFAYASWAFLSEEVAQRIVSGGAGLQAEEWKSGDQLWLIELKTPFGGEEFVREDLQSKIFKNQPIRHLAALRQEGFVRSAEDQDIVQEVFLGLEATKMDEKADSDIRIIRADEALRKRFAGLTIPFAKLFLMSGAFKGFGLDAAKLRQMIGRLIGRSDAILLVALYRGIPCGGFAGELHEFAFGRDRFAQEMAFLLHPRFRGKGIGKRLLAEFEVWARENGAVWLQYTQTSDLAPEAAEKAYIHSGAKRVGYVYRKPLVQMP